MTTVKTQATVRFGASGVVTVQPCIRLNGSSHIDCYVYDDSAPILSIDDEHVSVSVTVPDTTQVTDEDVKRGRALAEAVARYVVVLEQRAASNRNAAGSDQAA